MMILFLLIAMGMAVSQDVNNNSNHQIEYTKNSSKKKVHPEGKKGKKGKPNKKYKDLKKELKKWNQKCGCPNGTQILTQNHLPIKCACILSEYDKGWAPGGGGWDTTVTNTFQSIKVLDLNEVDKKISSKFKVLFRWKEDRISTMFPNNESEILITRAPPREKSFSIWAPTRLITGEPRKKTWKFHFLNSFSNDETMVEGHIIATMKSPCDLDFTDYPFDRNECEARITSELSGELREVLAQQCTKNGYYAHNVVSGLDVFITLFGNTINDTHTITNDFGFNMEIKRRITSYLIQYYLPCASIVAVSSISFIIPLSAIPGRVSLVVTLFLTLSNLIIQNEVSLLKMQNEKGITID